MVVLWLVESAQLADGAHPAVHVLLRLCHHVEGSLGRLDVEHKAVLELFAFEGESGVHLLAAVQVDDANGLFGMVTLVVLKNIRVSAHTPAAQDKPALLPSLQT